MEWVGYIVAVVVGLGAGAWICFLMGKARVADVSKTLEQVQSERDAARNQLETVRAERDSKATDLAAQTVKAEQADRYLSQYESLQTEHVAVRQKLASIESQWAERQKALEEQLQQLKEARVELTNQFTVAARNALKDNNAAFLELANENLKQREQAVGELVKPVAETLTKLDEHNRTLETRRVEAYSTLQEQVKQLMEQGKSLHTETGNLVKALREPHQRGRWGEIQLKRVVELAGMVNHCDFELQNTTDGGKLRPDMVVNLPNGAQIIVDAKTPLDGYLKAVEQQDTDLKLQCLKDHARHVRTHIDQLSQKSYHDKYKSAEMVVLFLPSDPIWSAAMEQDAKLIEDGAEKKVVIATPTTLIAILRAVAFGWQTQSMADNARVIAEVGKELHDRIGKMAWHFAKLTRSIEQTVEHHNGFVSSLESRVLPSARKLSELRDGKESDISPMHQIEGRPKEMTAAELVAPSLLEPEA